MSVHQSDLSDPALAAEVDLARAAAQEEAGDERVGAYVEHHIEDEAAVTHFFEADKAGYHGWRWAVTLTSAGPDTDITVSEVVLLPGPTALVAPEWIPWQYRVQAGDLGVGDLLPTSPDDPRLVPAYLQSDDPAVEEEAKDAGLGRVRVMSRPARQDAADRWLQSEFGPRSDMARSAPAHCGTCGFYLPLAGSLRAAFGTCGNELSPADGHVVHAEYGCGAHSEAEVEQVSPVLVADLIYDDALLDVEPLEVVDQLPAEATSSVELATQPTGTEPGGQSVVPSGSSAEVPAVSATPAPPSVEAEQIDSSESAAVLNDVAGVPEDSSVESGDVVDRSDEAVSDLAESPEAAAAPSDVAVVPEVAPVRSESGGSLAQSGEVDSSDSAGASESAAAGSGALSDASELAPVRSESGGSLAQPDEADPSDSASASEPAAAGSGALSDASGSPVHSEGESGESAAQPSDAPADSDGPSPQQGLSAEPVLTPVDSGSSVSQQDAVPAEHDSAVTQPVASPAEPGSPEDPPAAPAQSDAAPEKAESADAPGAPAVESYVSPAVGGGSRTVGDRAATAEDAAPAGIEPVVTAETVLDESAARE